MICSPEHLDYLVTAAEAYGTVPVGKEQELWSSMFMMNIDSVLRSVDADSDHELSMGMMLEYGRGYQRTELLIFPEPVYKALRTYEENARHSLSYWSDGLVRRALSQTLRAIIRRTVVDVNHPAYDMFPAHITKETEQKDVLHGRDASCRI